MAHSNLMTMNASRQQSRFVRTKLTRTQKLRFKKAARSTNKESYEHRCAKRWTALLLFSFAVQIPRSCSNCAHFQLRSAPVVGAPVRYRASRAASQLNAQPRAQLHARAHTQLHAGLHTQLHAGFHTQLHAELHTQLHSCTHSFTHCFTYSSTHSFRHSFGDCVFTARQLMLL